MQVVKNHKVFLAGELCIDNNTIEGKQMSGWGSSIMYIAHYLYQTYGLVVSAFSPYGNDFLEYIDASIKILNKSTSSKTLHYRNIVQAGKRTQFCELPPNYSLPPINSHITRSIKESELIIVSPMTPQYNAEYVSDLMKHANSRALKVLLPQGYMRNINANGTISPRAFKEIDSLAKWFNLIILSEEDTENAISQASKWASINTHLEVIVTQAGKGATLVDVNSTKHISTIPIPVTRIINPVGGGDTFSACVAIEKIICNEKTEECVRRAHVSTGRALKGLSATAA